MRIAHFSIGFALGGVFLLSLAAPAGAGILEVVPGAEAAYSLRQLHDGYAGYAIEVRSSGGGTANIGFDANGRLDTAALLSAVGAGNDGFVIRWYDQVGSAHVAQNTANLQPQIVANGAVVTDSVNGLPAIRFVDDALNYVGDLSNSTMSVFTAASWINRPTNNNSVAQRLWTMRASDSTRAAAGGNSSNFAASYARNPTPSHTVLSTGTPIVPNQPFVLSYLFDNTLDGSNDWVRLRLDGLQIGSVTNDLSVSGVNNFTVGSHTLTDRRFDGLMQELIVYHGSLSGANVARVEGRMMALYIPEPGSMLLLLAGGMMILACRRSRRSLHPAAQ